MIEGKEQTNEQRKAILDTIQELALENFQLGLRDEIQTIVRSRNCNNLAAATYVMGHRGRKTEGISLVSKLQ